MMKKLFQIFAIIFVIPLGMFGQDLPREYAQQYRDAERKVKELRKRYDVVLDPFVPMLPSEYSAQAGGNWGNDYLLVNKYAEEIGKRAGRKIAVFIFDTGQPDHPDLQRFNWNNYTRNFTGDGRNADGHGHSTHVAGIYGAINSNYDLGIARHLVETGMMKGIYIKVLNDDGAGQMAWITAGIEYALSIVPALTMQGWFCIFNFSLGAGGTNDQVNKLLSDAENMGVFVVASAGNNGAASIGTPANSGSAHAVGALDRSGTRAPYSSYGSKLYIVAPGSNILSTYLKGTLRESSGTSMAAPTLGAVAGIAAAVNPTATNRQISHFLKNTATDQPPAGWDQYTGYGAPILNKIMAGDATQEPRNGNGNPPAQGPPTTPPTKETRTLTFTLPETYRVLWRPYNSTSPQWRTAYVNYTVEVKTDLYAHDAYDRAAADTRKFFTNRGFLLRTTDDFADAAHWSRHFYERANDTKKYRVVNLAVADEQQRTAIVPRPAPLALKARVRAPEIKSLTGNWIY